MYITSTNSDAIAEYRKKFLFMDKFGRTPLDLNDFKGKCVIYAIQNKTNNKIYIGKTTNLLNRSNNYIWAYRNPETALKNHRSRKIIRAIIAEGIENFIMFPIDIAKNRHQLAFFEDKYINMYNAKDARYGYNTQEAGINYGQSYGGGHPHSIEAKISRSKVVACINPEKKELIISIGMKLFGDFIGFGKDMVKNCAKKPCKCRGYYIFYLPKKDRDEVSKRYLSKQEDYLNYLKKRGVVNIKDCHDNYDEYRQLLNMVEVFIEDKDIEVFTDMGYECKFLTYNTDPNANTTYVFEDIYAFMNLIEEE